MDRTPALSSRVVHYRNKLPPWREIGSTCFVIADRRLQSFADVQQWVRHAEGVLWVTAGEKLKDVQHFPKWITAVVNATAEIPRQELTLVAVGGGSVGDFAGFCAHVLRRGVRLVHVPSTWLAALDSAHGGKTALNVGPVKNAIGAFHAASRVFVCDSLLHHQGEDRAVEALGELVKMSLLTRDRWSKGFRRDRLAAVELLKKYLPAAIEDKYKIVEKDPLDKSGIRAVLNLGHTWGHVLETVLDLPHGTAVAQGIYFALKWSLQRDLLGVEDYLEMESVLRRGGMLPLTEGRGWRPLTKKAVLMRLVHDKKRSTRDHIGFVYLKGWGKPLQQKITVAEFLKEAVRQGWVR